MEPKREILPLLRELIDKELGVTLDGNSSPDKIFLLGRGIGIDSVELLRLVLAIEGRFDIIIEDEEITPANFSTFAAVANLIELKLS